MQIIKFYFLGIGLSFLIACGSGSNQKTGAAAPTTGAPAETAISDPEGYDPKRGEGKFSEENVKVEASLNVSMVAAILRNISYSKNGTDQ